MEYSRSSAVWGVILPIKNVSSVRYKILRLFESEIFHMGGFYGSTQMFKFK